MGRERRDEPTPEEMLRAVEQELGPVRAILIGVERAAEVLEVVASCEDADEAVEHLQSLLGVNELGARAVMDVQFRWMTGQQRRHIRARIRELEAERDRLREAANDSPSSSQR